MNIPKIEKENTTDIDVTLKVVKIKSIKIK